MNVTMSVEILDRLNLKVIGNGSQTMLFGQGIGLHHDIWNSITPAFENDYRIVLFGYNKAMRESHKLFASNRYANLNGYADDLVEICEELQIEQSIYVGHSVSSMIGLLASLKRPKSFQKMIFIGASPRYLNDEDGYFGGFKYPDVEVALKSIKEDYMDWIRKTMPAIVNTDNTSLEEEILNMFIAGDQRALQQFATATFFSDHRKDLLKLDKPCLILQTAGDSMVPLEVGDYLHAHLKNSTIRFLKGKGHFPQLTAPEELIDLIKEYLNTRMGIETPIM